MSEAHVRFVNAKEGIKVRYILAKQADGYWRAYGEGGGVAWNLGVDVDAASALVERLNTASSFHIQAQGEQLWVDWNDGRGFVCEIPHGRGQPLPEAKPVAKTSEMSLVISDGNTKREIKGPYRLLGSRADLQRLRHCLDKAIESEGGFLYGWVEVYEQAPDNDGDKKPIPFGAEVQ